QTAAVADGLRGFVAGAGDAVNVNATWWTIPAVPAFPAALHGRAVVIVGGAYAGPPAEGAARLRPLRELGEPLLDLSSTLPYTALQQLFDPFFPSGALRHYWKSIYLAGLGRDAVEEIRARMEARPSARSMASVWALGGALARVGPDETAAGERGA